MVAPVLSVAVIVMVPEYVPGSNVAALTLTMKVLPLPLSVPDVAERTSQALLPASPDAVQLTGREHVPVSLTVTFCAVEDCPCDTENARLAGDGEDSTQGGGKIVSVTENNWGLPCTAALLASLAERVTCAV